MFCNTYLTSLLFPSGFYISSIRPPCVRNVSLASVIHQKIKSKTENTILSNNGASEINVDVLHTESDKTESVSNQKTSKHCKVINKANKQDPKKKSKILHKIIADNRLFGKLINKMKEKYAQSVPEQTKSKEQSIEHSWILKVSKTSEVKYFHSPKMKDMRNDKVTDNETDTSNKLGDIELQNDKVTDNKTDTSNKLGDIELQNDKVTDNKTDTSNKLGNIELQNTLADASKNLWQSIDNSRCAISYETLNNVISFPIFHSDMFENFCIKYEGIYERHVPFASDVLLGTESLGRKMLSQTYNKRMVAMLGKDRYQIYRKESSRNGKLFHSCVAKTLCQEQIDVVMPLAVKLAYDSLKPFLNNLQNIEEINILVTHPNLRYRVNIDCIAWYRDTLCVFDWKKAHKRRKSFRMLFDAPLKLAACIGAVNASNSIPYTIDRGYIVSGCLDGYPAVVHKVDGSLLQQLWVEWLRRLYAYNANLNITEN